MSTKRAAQRNKHDVAKEKMTDVNLVTDLLKDVFEKSIDTAVIVSADSDYLRPIEYIRDQQYQRVIVAFPPARYSVDLEGAAQASLKIRPSLLKKCQFPDQVKTPKGFTGVRPGEWT